MSTGTRLPFDRAVVVSRQLSFALVDVCVRSKVVGSVRRRRPFVSDIEILIEPRRRVTDLFGSEQPDVAPIRALAERWGRVTKGGEKYIQVADALGMTGLTVDLFIMTPPAEWGPLLAIRTGPRQLGQHVVTELHRYGLRCEAARILNTRTGATVPCPDEETFFRLAHVDWLPPARRDQQAAELTNVAVRA